MASSTLQAIRTKVRRLTRSLSDAQLSDANIDEYINTFIQYDFPEHLRLFNLHRTFTFYTQPYQDVYETSTDANSPLYDFKNIVINVNPPVYIAGYQAAFMQSRDQFFALYPTVNAISSIGVSGDGATLSFTGYINTQQQNIQPFVQNNTQGIVLLKNNVLFDSVDINNNGLAMIDYPISSSLGNLYVPGGAPTSTTVQDVNNYINYLTGQFVVTFLTAPQAGIAINSQVVPLQPSLPQTVLFYDGKFTLRPIPDQPYRVQMEADVRPSELLSGNSHPDLNEWWQYIAYGASKKVFEDRMDMESVAQILPEYAKQECLVLRRTIVQQTNQRTSTIYADGSGVGGTYGGQGFGNGSF